MKVPITSVIDISLSSIRKQESNKRNQIVGICILTFLIKGFGSWYYPGVWGLGGGGVVQYRY